MQSPFQSVGFVYQNKILFLFTPVIVSKLGSPVDVDDVKGGGGVPLDVNRK